MAKEDRDIEKVYSAKEYAAKDEKFEIQIAGERVYVPVRAEFSIEHERGDGEEEIEFQIKWKND